MIQACRNALLDLSEKDKLINSSNAGLILARYLKEQKEDGHADNQKVRENLLNAAILAVDKPDFYRSAFERRNKVLGGTSGIFKIINGRMIIGLGGSNVLETGITLNHIYGTPIIPGSALKGLAAHYCASVWGNDPKFSKTGEYYDFMFGSTEDAGFLAFHDAWIKPSSLSGSLVRDVMTPHHSKYYASQGKDAAPTDFDDPTPLTFLSVKGEFEIRVSCENGGKEGKAWERIAMQLLKQALENWGIGGKTSSGYGRGTLDFENDSPSEQEKNSSVPPAGMIPVNPFSPGQQVEAVFVKLNKKGNPQLVVKQNSETINARWEGDWKGDVSKEAKIQATIKSYDPSRNPPLVLGSSQ